MIDRPTVLAIDAGTSAVRASLVELETGEILARSVATYSMTFPAPGRVEIDPRRLWEALQKAVDGLPEVRRRVVAICIAGEIGIVLVDRRGDPVGNAICWPDKRAVRQAQEVREALGGERLYRVTGRVLDPELPGAKLLWVRQEEPERMSRVARMLSIKDYLVQQLCGEQVTDEAHASYSMLYDVTARRWSEEILSELRLPRSLVPDVAPAAAVAGRLPADVSARLGLPSGLAVAVGGPDGTVGTVGAGLVVAGRTIDLIGTTDIIFHASDRPVMDEQRRAVVNAHIVPGLWSIGGPTGTTGGMIAWLAETVGFGSDGLVAYDREAASAAPGANGLACLTAMAGERFSGWEPAVKGVFFGVQLSHRRADLARAALEGAAFLVRSCLKTYSDLGLPIDAVRVVGGGARSRLWLQIRADISGCEMRPCHASEATTLGAAMLAGTAIGAFADLPAAAEKMIQVAPGIMPDPIAVAAYDRLYERYVEVRAALIPALQLLDSQLREHPVREDVHA